MHRLTAPDELDVVYLPPKRHLKPLPTRLEFVIRLLWRMLGVMCVLSISLAIGVTGYRVTEGLPWIDAILNAAMILTGMGEINPLQTTAGKLFASAYALFSGVVFLTSTAIIMAPVIHRAIHRFHMDIPGAERKEDPPAGGGS